MDTERQFIQFADLRPDALLLVTGGGTVLAASRGVERRLGLEAAGLRGRQLADFVADPPDAVARHLAACARSRELILGSLSVKGKDGPIACRSEGAVFRPRGDGAEAVVMLCLAPKEVASSRFVALTQQIDSLSREVTRRTRAEHALREQREWLRVTLSSIGDAVIATDAAGAVAFMNAAAEALTGWTQEEALGRPMAEVFVIVNEQTRLPAEDPVGRVLREGVVVGLANHTVLIARDGTQWPIDDSAAPIRGAQGELRGVVLVFRDVSEKHRAEAEASRAAERARTILESISDAFFAVDEAWRFTYVNRQAERILGRQPGDLLGTSLWDAYPGLVGSDFERTYRRVAAERVSLSLTSYYPDHDRWYEVHAYPAADGISIYFRDVSERERAKAEVARLTQASERQRRTYDTALSNSADFNYVFDLRGRFVYVNRPLLALWRKSLDEVVGRDFFELGYPPALAARLQSQIQQVIDTRQPLRDETPYTSAAGERQYEYIFVPVLGAGGDVEAVAGSTRDVTDRKRHEEALRDADRRKDEFLATLAHELRNPMAPIRNGLQVMKLAPDPAARERAREMMERQMAQMVRLVDDLLDVSRITRDKLELRKATIELRSVVENAVETARPQIEAGGHAVTVNLPQTPVFLDADLTRLSQVFWNLLNNSARYTEPGGRIELIAVELGAEVEVTVRDTGIGIPAEALPGLFAMFSQVDRSLERAQGGLGIGLALVKGLTQMHGGTVTAHSDGPGKGSRFVVRLPVVREAPQREQPAAPGLRSGGPSRKVLVVDDNRDGAASLAMLLSLTGNDARTAHDGLEAVEMAEAFRPDVIVLDIGLPKLNGYDACRRIRERPWGKGVVIVAATGWGQDEDRRRSKEAGFDHHLVKPVDPAELARLLTSAGAGSGG